MVSTPTGPCLCNKEMLAQHLGKPLTAVPDPFSNEHPSFGAANNARLRAFLGLEAPSIDASLL